GERMRDRHGGVGAPAVDDEHLTEAWRRGQLCQSPSEARLLVEHGYDDGDRRRAFHVATSSTLSAAAAAAALAEPTRHDRRAAVVADVDRDRERWYERLASSRGQVEGRRLRGDADRVLAEPELKRAQLASERAPTGHARCEALSVAHERGRRDCARPEEPAAGVAEGERHAVLRERGPVGRREVQHAAQLDAVVRAPTAQPEEEVRGEPGRRGDEDALPRASSADGGGERELVVDVRRRPRAEGLERPADGRSVSDEHDRLEARVGREEHARWRGLPRERAEEED